MNKKETSEIRRQLTPDRTTVDRISGCYISESREIISRFDLPTALLPEDEKEKYLTIFRKTLNGFKTSTSQSR